MLFNKNDNGGDELFELLGFIDVDTKFNKWKTWIDLSVRQITALTGKAVYTLADNHYNSDKFQFETTGTLTEETTPKLSEVKAWKVTDELVSKFQLANALFAYVRLLPSLDAGHGNGGRKKTLGEKEKGLTAVEQYKDEANILNLGYEALEDLLEFLEANAIKEWIESDTRKSTANLLVPNVDVFNEYVRIDSARLFYTLVPMIREVQNKQLVSMLTATRIADILSALSATDPSEQQQKLITLTREYIRRPLVLSVMALALRRLPLELLPEGIVQTQIVGTVKEKLAANDQTRQSLIITYEKDADTGYSDLQEQIAVLNGIVPTERYVEPPRNNPNIKGFGF